MSRRAPRRQLGQLVRIDSSQGCNPRPRLERERNGDRCVGCVDDELPRAHVQPAGGREAAAPPSQGGDPRSTQPPSGPHSRAAHGRDHASSTSKRTRRSRRSGVNSSSISRTTPQRRRRPRRRPPGAPRHHGRLAVHRALDPVVRARGTEVQELLRAHPDSAAPIPSHERRVAGDSVARIADAPGRAEQRVDPGRAVDDREDVGALADEDHDRERVRFECERPPIPRERAEDGPAAAAGHASSEWGVPQAASCLTL